MSDTCDSDFQSLTERLRERIQREGPITFRDWMQTVLYDEREGYYCRRGKVRQARTGDYRTAPETSPLFASTFANYFVKLYFELGAPSSWTIVEVGAGAGDFARGILTSLKLNFPKVFAATRYIIDEISADAQAQALIKLDSFKDRVQFSSLPEIEAPLFEAIIFSNELLDAFPVHRVIGRRGNLCELCVGLNDRKDFTWAETDLHPRVAAYCDRIQLQLAEGQIFEINLDTEDFLRRVASLINSGYLITVDYGAARKDLLNDPNRVRGTLRTFHRHRLGADPLSNPGEHDLTVTIDWTQMIEAGERNGFETLTLQRLDQFLLAEGAIEMMEAAAATVSDHAELLNYNVGARELIIPTGMASHFQLLVQRKSTAHTGR